MNLESFEIDYLFGVVSGLVYFAIGWAWYSPLLFMKPWLAEQGKTMEDVQGGGGGVGPILALTLVTTVLTTLVMALMYEWGSGDGVIDGLVVGLLIGVGVVALEAVKDVAYLRQSWRMFAIQAGYPVVGLAAAGAVYGAFA